MIVYAVYDRVDMKIYQFAAADTVLVKDAVLAFAQENTSALFGIDSGEGEEFKNFMTAVSSATSIEEVSAVLRAVDMDFNLIKIS